MEISLRTDQKIIKETGKYRKNSAQIQDQIQEDLDSVEAVQQGLRGRRLWIRALSPWRPLSISMVCTSFKMRILKCAFPQMKRTCVASDP